ncbi:hypothetical protein NKH77_54275 [Streptomyces sp. M19]
MTIVEPAAFRTNWSGPSMRQSATVIEDYAGTAGAPREHHGHLRPPARGPGARRRGDHHRRAGPGPAAAAAARQGRVRHRHGQAGHAAHGLRLLARPHRGRRLPEQATA